MKVLLLVSFALIWIGIALGMSQNIKPVAQPTPNANLALEARVTTLEGQVRELRRVVGIDKGLKEGLQNRGKK